MDEQIFGTSAEEALFFQRREDGGDSLEVSVVVQQGRLGLYGARCNQTVRSRSHGDAALPAIQVDAGGRGVTRSHVAECIKLWPTEVASQSIKRCCVACALKNLHIDQVRNPDSYGIRQQISQEFDVLAISASDVIDPHRGIYQVHEASGSGGAQFLVVILRVEEIRTLKFPQIKALPMVDEFPQRLVDQFPLGLYPAQFLRLPNKFGIKLDIGSHFLHLLMCILMCIHIGCCVSSY